MSRSHLQIVLGQERLQKIRKSNILVIGVGGIGCEFIKCLSKSGFRKFTILDLDHIESTNLNRQFYFREHHVGQGKAQVGKESLLKIDPGLEIIAINGNIRDKEYDCQFYSQFDMIISALDNMKARQHLAKMATMSNKPLVDAGTQAYNGQAKPNIRFITDCHNCNPSKGQESYAACTIRSRPEKPVHCAVYAKSFYDSFFGGQGTHALKGAINYQHYIKIPVYQHTQQQLRNIGIQLFEELFSRTINDVDDDGNKIPLVRKIPYDFALTQEQEVQNPTLSTYKQEQFVAQRNSSFEQEKLWSLKKYAEKFVQSIVNLLKKKQKGEAPPKFEKDDNDCATLVCCIMNVRTANFINQMSPSNKHKFLTYYQCKDMAGKIQPAIASTNSIVAALQTREMINILAGELGKLKYIAVRNYSLEKLCPLQMSGPNLDCLVCSGKAIYAAIECNIAERTFGQMQDFVEENFYTYGRTCYSGPSQVLKRNESGSPHPNRRQKLNFNENIISPNNVLSLTFLPTLNMTPLSVEINVIHNPQVKESFKIVNTPSKQQLRNQVMQYYRMKHKQSIQGRLYDISDYGYF